MPKFKVRLESPDMLREDGSPHFRVGHITADTAEDAAAVFEKREYKACVYTLPDSVVEAHEQAAMDAAEQGVKAPALVRGQLHTHRQAKPYAVVSVQEIG